MSPDLSKVNRPDLVYDAEIVAIINAESIKNPYSQDRIRLLELIEKFGSVEFLQEQFINDVERTTSVEAAFIHGIRGPYDGLVDGFEQNSFLQAQRISTRYFDFRYYKGTQTLHLYPKSEDVVEKINKFVGKLRQWIPGNMEEMNRDFQDQYHKGEALTKDYMASYRKNTRASYGLDRPAIRLLREIRGQEVDGRELDRLHEAIESVHQAQGLRCAPALSSESEKMVMTLGYDSVAPERNLFELL